MKVAYNSYYGNLLLALVKLEGEYFQEYLDTVVSKDPDAFETRSAEEIREDYDNWVSETKT